MLTVLIRYKGKEDNVKKFVEEMIRSHELSLKTFQITQLWVVTPQKQ